MGTERETPGSFHLWSVADNVSSSSVTCLSCNTLGPSCSFSQFLISPGRKKLIQHCLGPDIPFSRIMNLERMEEIIRLDNNDRLTEIMRTFSTPKVKDLSLSLPNSPFPANIRLFLPAGFRDNEEFKFPLVIAL